MGMKNVFISKIHISHIDTLLLEFQALTKVNRLTNNIICYLVFSYYVENETSIFMLECKLRTRTLMLQGIQQFCRLYLQIQHVIGTHGV